MTVSKTSPLQRLNRLLKAKQRIFALPRGELRKGPPMAKELGVSWPTLRGWCDDIDGFEQSGAFERGAQGVNYEFCPVRTVWFLIEYFEAEVGRITAKNEKIVGPAAVEIIGEAAAGMTPEELNKSLAVAERIEDWKIRQGKLLDGDKARSDFNTYHLTIQESVLRSAQQQDPDGSWAPEMRSKWDASSRRVLVDVQRAGQKCAAELGGAPPAA